MSEKQGPNQEELMSRRNFIQETTRFVAGAAIAGAAGELAAHLSPEGENSAKANEEMKTAVEYKDGSYPDRVEQALVDGVGDAYQELVVPVKDKRTLGQKSIGYGLASGAVVTALDGALTKSEKDPSEDPFGLLAEKIAPFAAFGLGGAAPGVIRSQSAEAEYDPLYSAYTTVLREVRAGVEKLSAFDTTPSVDVSKAQSTARQCLLEIGLEDFDVTDMASIREAAKQFALTKLKK